MGVCVCVHISTNGIDIMLFASAKIYTIHFMALYGIVHDIRETDIFRAQHAKNLKPYYST